MTAKKLIGQLHLWLGIASGLVVIVVALTGSILVFEDEIDEWANKDFFFVEVPANTQRLPLDHLLQQAKAYDTSLRISNIHTVTAEADRTVLFTGRKEKRSWNIAVNPYTGQVIRAIEREKRFFSIVLQLHRYLLMGKVGKAITGVSCLIFVILVISGLILWWPKKLKMLKQRVKIKWNGSGKRLNWDLHAVGGFYVHLCLFMISFTGLTWAYEWFNKSIYLVFDGQPQKKFVVPANKIQQPITAGFYEQVYTKANEQLPYKGEINIAIPDKDSLSITVSKQNYDASVSNISDVLYYEKGTGTLLKERLYTNESLGTKARRMVYPIHTGSLYGWPTKILALISALVAVSLPITGFRIWLGRKKKAKKPVAARGPATVKEPLPAREIAVNG